MNKTMELQFKLGKEDSETLSKERELLQNLAKRSMDPCKDCSIMKEMV